MLTSTIAAHSKAIVSIKFNPLNSGSIFLTSSADKKACLFNSLTGELLRTFSEHTLGLNGCEWFSNGKYFVTWSDDKFIKLWDVEHDKCVSTLSCHKSFAFSLAVHPTTDILICGNYDGNIRLMDVRSPSRINNMLFNAHTKPITSISCSDDNYILSSSYDGYTRLWDINSSLDACPCISSLYNSEFTPV